MWKHKITRNQLLYDCYGDKLQLTYSKDISSVSLQRAGLLTDFLSQNNISDYSEMKEIIDYVCTSDLQ